MPVVTSDTIAEFHRLLARTETDGARRERLFEPFWAPRSAVVKRMTRSVIRFALSEGDALRGAKVLDYGCGVKPYDTLFRHLGARLTGADFPGNPRADVTLSDRGTLPAGDEHFDYVLSVQVLEHVANPNDYLREAWRVLKPNGKLFLTTHGVWPYHPTPDDYHRWTRSGLVLELVRGGFDVQAVHHILNEYAAAVQFFAITGEYRGVWRRLRLPLHVLAYGLIWLLERWGRHEPEVPAILCALARKPAGAAVMPGKDARVAAGGGV